MTIVVIIFGWVIAAAYSVGLYDAMAHDLARKTTRAEKVAVVLLWPWFLPYTLGMHRGKW